MSAKSDNVRDAFADQLASFDDRLHATTGDVAMLADIQEGIGSLLASTGSSEGEIRRILQERYDEGALRQETFQLVKSMLDRYVTENVPTSRIVEKTNVPTMPSKQDNLDTVDVEKGADIFGSTTVIPSGFMTDNSADSRVQVGSVLRDRFMLQQKISGGSMGVVYKALDRRLAEAGSKEHWVAIKILSPQLAENGEALRALQQEAAKGRCLVHPNIVRFLDLDRDDDLYFLIMEWLDGRTLAEILDSPDAGIIDHDAAFRIVRQIANALDYAHRCGIIHADVKPGNIMIMPNGDAKLFDFGVARVQQKHAESSFDPGVLGAITPAYSSMQVLTGEDPTPMDDVFSLACLLYRLIAGYRVFGPRNAAEASEEGMEPQRLPALSDSQWRGLKKALAYSRIMRFKSVGEFIDAIDEGDSVPLEVEEPAHLDMDEQGSSRKWAAALVVIFGLLVAASYQTGLMNPLLDVIKAQTVARSMVVVEEPATESVVAEVYEGVVSEPEIKTSVAEEPADLPADSDVIAEIEAQQPEPTKNPLIEYSRLPSADVVVQISRASGFAKSVHVVLREDGSPVIIDFVRSGDLASPLTLRLEEVGFTGNRSPRSAGQYSLSESGIVEFPVGQVRGRVTLTMASDPRREADQQSKLSLREAGIADSEWAIINVTLEDDDQRAFEASLPPNTIAFATSQASLRETDPAVQIDLVRLNPDGESIVVEFAVHDITATEGEDYFAPGSNLISFGPGQRSARLLIPLVQDFDVEGDEAFVVELIGVPATSAMDVYRRIVVMIRDDEPQAP